MTQSCSPAMKMLGSAYRLHRTTVLGCTCWVYRRAGEANPINSCRKRTQQPSGINRSFVDFCPRGSYPSTSSAPPVRSSRRQDTSQAHRATRTANLTPDWNWPRKSSRMPSSPRNSKHFRHIGPLHEGFHPKLIGDCSRPGDKQLGATSSILRSVFSERVFRGWSKTALKNPTGLFNFIACSRASHRLDRIERLGATKISSVRAPTEDA